LETAEALRQRGLLRVARIAKKARKMRAFFLKRRYLLLLHRVLISGVSFVFPPLLDHIPDLPPPEEFGLEPVPAVPFPGAALPEGDLPPLNPVGLEPLLDPVVPLPGLRLVGFDPLLEPVPVAGLALPTAGTLPGAMPGAR
jgi:hypothetical protein